MNNPTMDMGVQIGSSMVVLFYLSIYLFMYLFMREGQRERERDWEQGRGRERGTERPPPSRLRTVSSEPDVGLELTNREIMT